MRFPFKTDYRQDIRLFELPIDVTWYALLAAIVLIAPLWLDSYYISQLTLIFIYAVVSVGLMLLSGYTGQISIGHAAFLAVGAYTEAVFAKWGAPFLVSLPAAFIASGLIGIIVGLPALRVKGIYLAIATLAFGFIVEEALTRWESVTGGSNGLQLGHIQLPGLAIDSGTKFYYLSLAILVLILLGTLNLLRSPTGRAFVAIRDSQISAQSMGINLAKYKTTAFALSAAITGVAGVLYAHKLRFISPEQFGIQMSVELLMMIVIGGLGSLHGAILGAIFIIALPEAISAFKDYLPPAIAQQTGLQPTIFGIVLIGFILFEPEGLHGRWVKIRTYFELFPFYRRAMFSRQKTYMKSERLN
ncbi:MAG TPA: branched-chain amino acid ABC transporter permease [Noviherbaspirillum sp.]|uniref:branched-chain amino acid ABC transporter permease n=1 Tax=Noviherbaspirillum sp. TaxID=1926288 RepID=UPI002B46A85C|nr:branched-chain amino acid ABC transporter permease [Noviherbaspirillum sp.]HJV88449.1 branched-chain amino acid ABC transporter permease [Noviherbaspirillum sp.]